MCGSLFSSTERTVTAMANASRFPNGFCKWSLQAGAWVMEDHCEDGHTCGEKLGKSALTRSAFRAQMAGWGIDLAQAEVDDMVDGTVIIIPCD